MPIWASMGQCTFATTQLTKFHGPHEGLVCVLLETPTSRVIAKVTSNRVQWQGQLSMLRLDPASIYATRKSPEISQLWDHEMARKQGYALVTKLSPHICAYIVICAKSGIGITCSLHWSTHETAHVTPLYYHTLVLHWAHSVRRMKQPLWSHCSATHKLYMEFTLVGPQHRPCTQRHNTVPVHKDIVLPYICMTWVLHWSTHETGHVNQCLAKHWNYMGFTLVGPCSVYSLSRNIEIFHFAVLLGITHNELVPGPESAGTARFISA